MGFKIGGLLEDITGQSLFGEKGKVTSVPQTEAAKKARARLETIAAEPPPAVPRREIAPLPPITEERKLARETAKELIAPQDFFQLPEVQGIIQEARTTGDLLANRIGRGLQLAGAFATTPGRDILGRTVTNVQKSLAASLAPFAAEERGRRRGLIPTLEGLGLTEEERARGVTQAEKDALFQQQLTESQQLQTFTIPLLQSIIGLQPGVILQPREPGLIEQIAPLLTAAAVAGSDERLKEDIKTITSALEKIKQLDGKVFKFIDGPKSGGVIAQDVEKVMPEIVGEKDGFKTVDYTAIIGLLVNAVKELLRKVEKNGTTSN
jgi:hypothetical protein